MVSKKVIENFKKGIVSKPIDLSRYNTGKCEKVPPRASNEVWGQNRMDIKKA